METDDNGDIIEIQNGFACINLGDLGPSSIRSIFDNKKQALALAKRMNKAGYPWEVFKVEIKIKESCK